jgi:hypothetical protein
MGILQAHNPNKYFSIPEMLGSQQWQSQPWVEGFGH